MLGKAEEKFIKYWKLLPNLLGKSIPLAQHEQLIIEALEKQKRRTRDGKS